MTDLPELKGTKHTVTWAKEIREKAMKSGKFGVIYINLLRRINDADWWVANQNNLDIGKFTQPKAHQLEPIARSVPLPKVEVTPRKSMFAWWRKVSETIGGREKVTYSSSRHPEGIFTTARQVFRDADTMFKDAETMMHNAEREFIKGEMQSNTEIQTVRMSGKRFKTFRHLLGSAFKALLFNKTEVRFTVKRK